jgi:hypothetical protein
VIARKSTTLPSGFDRRTRRRQDRCIGIDSPVLLRARSVAGGAQFQKRNAVSFLRGPYDTALFDRHNDSFLVGAALHFSHAKQHDVLLLTSLADRDRVDAEFDADSSGVYL